MMEMALAVDALAQLIDEPIASDGPIARRFLPSLLASGHGIAAIVLYGSRLSQESASRSEPDFYVVVDSWKAYRRGAADYLLSLFLPPTTYHLRRTPEESAAEASSLVDQTAKLCVISAAQLARETSLAAADLHHLGRFSKRIALLYARDEPARLLVRASQKSALEAMTRLCLPLLPTRFTLDEFLLELLRLSYRGEPRVTELHKVESLFKQDQSHYREVGEKLLAGAHAETLPHGLYARPPLDDSAALCTSSLLARSRRRALLRMPKYLLTFDGWLDYVLGKVERNIGRPVKLTPLARKHPLLFAWPQLLSLRRQGLVK